MHGYEGDKDAYLKRLRRIEGQIRGLQRMIDEDEYCIDVLTQISAATKALQSVALGLMDDHLQHCVAAAVAGGGKDADEKLAEASPAIRRLVLVRSPSLRSALGRRTDLGRSAPLSPPWSVAFSTVTRVLRPTGSPSADPGAPDEVLEPDC